MEREYKEIVTPSSKQTVKMKSWLTGRERRDIRSVLLSNVQVKMETKEGSNEMEPTAGYELDGNAMSAMQDKRIEVVVVSIDGQEDKVLEKILDMREDDFDFVVKEIDAISNGLSEEEKKS